jgi:hypothetical protein
MTANIWDSFDAAVDTEALANDVKNSADGPVYKDVAPGQYEVKIEKLELIASKANKPMATVWMKILSDGEYKGSRLFYNQVLEQAFQIHSFNEFLRSLGTDLDVEFKSYRQYGNLLMDIHEAISDKLEYAVSYSKNSKGYPVYEIEEIFEVG